MSSQLCFCSKCGVLEGALSRAFVTMVHLLMLRKCAIVNHQAYPPDAGKLLVNGTKIDFDFIIVGAGTAGVAVAKGLTDHRKFNVLVLEAGTLPSESTYVPSLTRSIRMSREDWKFVTERQDNICVGYKGKRCFIHKGKVVGGSATINNMHYVRANPDDFRTWLPNSEEQWDNETLTPMFDEVENCLGESCDFFGREGYLTLTTVTEMDHPAVNLIFQGLKEMGECETLRGGRKYLGYFHVKAWVKNGKRCTFAEELFDRMKNRTNIFLIKNALVTKVNFAEKDPKAVSVDVIINGTTYTIPAKREIILAAGAINTPKILMLSGIGREAHLKSAGVKPIADLPVGENLQVQITFPVIVGIKTTWESPTPDTDVIDDSYNYVMYRKGRMSKLNVFGIVGLINTQKYPYDYPTVKLQHYYFRKNDAFLPVYLDLIGFVPEITKSVVSYNRDYSIIIFVLVLLKPKSRGKVLLNCKDPVTANPVITANFFTDKENVDSETLLAGFRYISKLVKRPAYKAHNATILNIDLPSCRSFKFGTDGYVRCLLRNMAFPLSNVAGTAAMGHECDNSVVNEVLQVKRVRALRVVDASVMPELVSCNTQPTEAVVAKRAVEFLERRWLKRYDAPVKKLEKPCEGPICVCPPVPTLKCGQRG